MKRNLLLGIDVGTTSLKAILFDVDGTILSQASQEYPTVYPHPNWAEQDPEDGGAPCATSCRSFSSWPELIHARLPASASAAKRRVSCRWIAAVQRFAPRTLWLDRCVEAQCAWLRERVGAAAIAGVNGGRIDPYYLAPKWLWLRKQIDVLLIDDIQFIAGKESTQEEFFHTFNTLHGQDKQIVITSDRPPKAMLTLETRLRSRFEGGLIVDVQLPDVETRIAILKSKADRARRNVDQHIMELIAQQVQSNIRELEGALTRVLAFADLSGMPLDEKLVSVALADMLPDHENFDPDYILHEVARAFNVPFDRLMSRDRSREVALPRQVAMYLIREEGNYSLPQIGAALGADHATIMYGCEKVADLMERDDRLRRQVYQIREKLYGSSIVV